MSLFSKIGSVLGGLVRAPGNVAKAVKLSRILFPLYRELRRIWRSDDKPIILSKTILLNAAMALSVWFWPPLSEWLIENPEAAVTAWAAINAALRKISKGKVSVGNPKA